MFSRYLLLHLNQYVTVVHRMQVSEFGVPLKYNTVDRKQYCKICIVFS